MAAHDLRTPIGHILSCSDFLREEAATVLTQEQLEFLPIIRSSSEFMLHLINDLLVLLGHKIWSIHHPKCEAYSERI